MSAESGGPRDYDAGKKIKGRNTGGLPVAVMGIRPLEPYFSVIPASNSTA